MTVDADIEHFPSTPVEEYQPLLNEKVRGESFDLPASKCDYLMFMSIGLGSSWVLLTAHFIELPWFERSQPEGIELAAWFGLVGTFALALCLGSNVYCGSRIMGANATLMLSIFNIFVNVLVAFTWHWTLGGSSVFLLFGGFGAAFVGNFSVMIVIPWVAANFPPSLTNAYISGEGLMAVFGVMLQIAQSPGEYRRFSPTVYYMIVAAPCISSLCCILYIWSFPKVREGSNLKARKHNSMCPKWFRLQGLKYAVYKIWSEAITWWIMVVILPYACAVTDPVDHLGTDVLQWCTILGTTGLWLGNMSSSFYGKKSNFHLNLALLIMTCLAIVVVFAMYDIPGGGFWARYKLLLIADVALLRSGYGYLTPLIFRDIARKLPNISEKAGRLMGFWTQVVSMIVKVVMFIVTTTALKNDEGKSAYLIHQIIHGSNSHH